MALVSRCLRVCRASVQTAGHVSCIAILASSQTVVDVLRIGTKVLVHVISTLTCAHIDQDALPPHRERVLSFQEGASSDLKEPHPLLSYRPNTGCNGNPSSEPFQVLDEAKTLDKVKQFYLSKGDAMPPLTQAKHFGNEELLTVLVHAFISSEFGCLNTDLLAEDFQFVFPVVGPLTKAQFVEAFSRFEVRKAFPNMRSNFYNFKIDPLEPNRIWALTRGGVVQEGTFGGFLKAPPPPQKQTNLPPQMFSWSFDESGKVYKMTGGYVVDRAVGDTEGLGGMFGILKGITGRNMLPFPEGKPWNAWTRSCAWDAWALRTQQLLLDWRKALS